MMKLKLLAGAAMVAGLSAGLSVAQAASCTVGTQCTDNGVTVFTPQNQFPDLSDEHKVFLVAGSGTTVTGNVGSQTGSPTVQFVSPDSVTAAQGFSTIKPTSGDTFSSITVSIPNNTFTDLIFVAARQPPVSGDFLNISVDNVTGPDSTFSYDFAAGNFQALTLSLAGANIASVTISGTAGLTEVKEFQVSGVVPGPIAGAGLPALFAFGGLLWARRRKTAAAPVAA